MTIVGERAIAIELGHVLSTATMLKSFGLLPISLAGHRMWTMSSSDPIHSNWPPGKSISFAVLGALATGVNIRALSLAAGEKALTSEREAPPTIMPPGLAPPVKPVISATPGECEICGKTISKNKRFCANDTPGLVL